MLDGALLPHAEAIIRFFLQNTASDCSAGQVDGSPEFWGRRPKPFSGISQVARTAHCTRPKN